MTWVRTSDDLHEREAILRLIDLGEDGLIAIALDRLAETWVARNMTDGVLPRGQVARLVAPNDASGAVAALIRVGLWEEADGGWRLTTWFEPSGSQGKPRNPSKAEVLAERQRRKALSTAGGVQNARNVEAEGRRGHDGRWAKRPDGDATGAADGAPDGAPDRPAAGPPAGVPHVPMEMTPADRPTPSPDSRFPFAAPMDPQGERDSPPVEKGARGGTLVDPVGVAQ